MSTINEAVNRVRELLLNPKNQKPNIKLVFGNLLREFSNIYNELSNSSVAWTVKETVLNLTGSGNDYVLSGVTGKVLFVTAGAYPYQVEFTDLADASTDWWWHYPLTAARPEDYNFAAYPLKIAFYRKDRQLYARVPTGFTDALTIVSSVGNWAEGVSANSRPVLSEYEHLAHIRAARNLTVEARWTDDVVLDERKADRLNASLAEQEARVYKDFIYAKRSLTADDVTYIETADCYF